MMSVFVVNGKQMTMCGIELPSAAATNQSMQCQRSIAIISVARSLSGPDLSYNLLS